jgi:hypothetical protein
LGAYTKVLVNDNRFEQLVFLSIACVLSLINSRTRAELAGEWPVHDTLITTILSGVMLGYGGYMALIVFFTKRGKPWAVARGSELEVSKHVPGGGDRASGSDTEDEETANPLNEMVSRIESERRDAEVAALRQEVATLRQAAAQPALQARPQAVRPFKISLSCRPIVFIGGGPYQVDRAAGK